MENRFLSILIVNFRTKHKTTSDIPKNDYRRGHFALNQRSYREQRHVIERKIAVETKRVRDGIVSRKGNFAKTKRTVSMLSKALDEMKIARDQSQQTNLRFTTSHACESYGAGSSTVTVDNNRSLCSAAVMMSHAVFVCFSRGFSCG